MEVDVEVRDGPKDSFGRGRKCRMTFGELLDGQSHNHYLSTQNIADGHLVAPPLTALAAHGTLPLRPALLGPLVPQSINAWVGHSSEPASSGLHHDFHDNLYVLLRGVKRFRLFSPADAEHMATAGAIARASSLPQNFSRFGALNVDERGELLPTGLGRASLAECELEAGEMLYLPAGWFHEVRSIGAHVAINYWYHPPDGRTYEQPYTAGDFWEKEWRRTLAATRREAKKALTPAP